MKPNGSLQITVWDSAAAPCTARDYKRIFALCGINNIKVRRHAVQPRASNECGLHVLLWAYRLLALTTRPEDINKPAVKGLFSLRKWRRLFQRHHNLGTEPKISKLIETIPHTQVWLNPITKEAKGDICGGARPKCPGCHGQLTRTGDCLSAVCPAPYTGTIKPMAETLTTYLSRGQTKTNPTTTINIDDEENTANNEEILMHQRATEATQRMIQWKEAEPLIKNKSTADELTALRSIWEDALSVRQNENEKCKNKIQPKEITLDTTSIPLYKLPRGEALNVLTAYCEQRETNQDDRERIFKCKKPGSFIHSTITDAIIEEINNFATSRSIKAHVVGTMLFAQYSNNGTQLPRPKKDTEHVAAGVHIHDHFICLTFDTTTQNIECYDSLNPHLPHPETINRARRFAQLMIDWELINQKEFTFKMQPCKTQNVNECALEMASNIAVRRIAAFRK